METNLLIHTRHETTYFDVKGSKLQTAKVDLLLFAGKSNAKLNLLVIS